MLAKKEEILLKAQQGSEKESIARQEKIRQNNKLALQKAMDVCMCIKGNDIYC